MESQNSLTDLFRRVHFTSEIHEQLSSLLSIDSLEHMQKTSIRPLKLLTCESANKPFVCCDFNAHQNSFRSPYSNVYIPAVSGPCPSKSLRDIETRANSMFEEYTEAFYKYGKSSVYVKETSERSYAVCFALINETDSGRCDILHVIDLVYDGHHKTLFKLVTRMLLTVKSKGLDLTGSICKSNEEGLNRLEDSKQELSHMLRMIENMESTLRRFTTNFVHSKSIQACNACRSIIPENERKRDKSMLKNLWSEQTRNEPEEVKLSG